MRISRLFTTILILAVALSSVTYASTGSSNIELTSRSKLSYWSQWLSNAKDILLGQMGLHPLSLEVSRNTSSPNPLNDLKLDFSNPTALGMPADWVIDPECTVPEKWFYRTIDGSCNWPRVGETAYGKAGTQFSRDVMKSFYDDGISTPRKGPNERALSNAFFAKTTEDTDYEHTPILVGLIEFVIHDIAFSMSSRELIETPVPKCDAAFDPQCTGNKTMKAWRSAALEGTGTDPSNPRETKNGVTSWLDLSALYGSNPEIAKKLRTLKNGKLLTQKGPDGKDYPPYNTFGVPILGYRPGVDPAKLFAFGDPRGNQDWLIIAVETLLLREHNRLCDIIQSQFPVWEDETVYQFARHALSVKYQMIANLYQQAYFTEEMPRPHIDGVPLFRQWHAKNALQMNAVTHFPFWPGLVNGKPVTTSQEMAIGYRFHEILPTNVPLVNETGQINGTYNVVKTAFDSEGFMKAGLENVLRGMAAVQIPNFHTGTSDEYRNMVFNFGDPSENVFYDLVAKTITHERERGLPAFNDYFRAYTGKPQVRIRKTFEDFTTNPVYLKALKELYSHPDEVDLTVGQYLDEDYFPGTTVPRSQLITSLFSLFGLGVSDRFSPGYISVKCLPFFGTQTPFTCTPTNALEYLLWKPTTFLGFKVHWYDAFWARELSIDDYGTSSLWRLVTENSDVKCLQKNPLFPMDPVTNPVVCSYEEFYPGTWLATFIKGGFIAFIIITSILCVRPSFRPQQEE